MKHLFFALSFLAAFVMLENPARSQPPGRWGGPRGDRSTAETLRFEAPPLPKDNTEKHILATLKLMQAGPRYANVPDRDGRLLRLLAESVGAKRVVEIGTSTGESAVWFALALCGAILAGAVYLPGISTVLRVIPPDGTGWLVVLGMSLAPTLLSQLSIKMGVSSV